MQYLICYDISEDKIRRKVVKLLEETALRIQYSVFIAELTDAGLHRLQKKLLTLTEPSEHSLLLIVPLCQSCRTKIWKKGSFLEEVPACIVA